MSRIENRVFFPQAALDEWTVDGVAELQDGELTLLTEGRRFIVSEAVRVLDEVSGSGDVHELAGRAKGRSSLEALGAEIFETSMLLGESAYDVQPGWLGTPVGNFAQHMASDERRKARNGRSGGEPKTDEELMAQFLSRKP